MILDHHDVIRSTDTHRQTAPKEYRHLVLWIVPLPE